MGVPLKKMNSRLPVSTKDSRMDMLMPNISLFVKYLILEAFDRPLYENLWRLVLLLVARGGGGLSLTCRRCVAVDKSRSFFASISAASLRPTLILLLSLPRTARATVVVVERSHFPTPNYNSGSWFGARFDEILIHTRCPTSWSQIRVLDSKF